METDEASDGQSNANGNGNVANADDADAENASVGVDSNTNEFELIQIGAYSPPERLHVTCGELGVDALVCR